MPLTPGDHIWLAGCVLAYDIDVKADIQAVHTKTDSNIHLAQTTFPASVRM
jgi:hypothetical protein